MKELDDTVLLPEAFFRDIGRIMVCYANLELRLRLITYETIKLNQKYGRIIRVARRLPEYLVLIRELLQAQDKDISLKKPAGWSDSLSDMLEIAQEERDRLAHGVWLVDPEYDRPVLQVVEKSWKTADGSIAKAKIRPHSLLLGDEYLPSVVRHFDVCFEAVALFRQQVLNELRH